MLKYNIYLCNEKIRLRNFDRDRRTDNINFDFFINGNSIQQPRKH